MKDWPPAARTRESFWGRTARSRPPATGRGVGFRPVPGSIPADPTPSPGGALLTQAAGRVDNRAVEARDSVLVYTSAVLTEDVEAIGPVSAEIRLRSSQAFFDVLVRICDVAPDGRRDVCDGLTRVVAADGESVVAVDLWPTAYRWSRSPDPRADRRCRPSSVRAKPGRWRTAWQGHHYAGGGACCARCIADPSTPDELAGRYNSANPDGVADGTDAAGLRFGADNCARDHFVFQRPARRPRTRFPVPLLLRR